MTGEQRVPERAIARLRPHARVLVVPAFVLISAVAVATFAAAAVGELWQSLSVLAIAFVIVGAGWVLPLLSWLSTQYLITTRRVVLQHGLFVRTRREVLLGRNSEVTVRQSRLQSLFRSGDVLLSAGADRPVILRDVPRADLVQRALGDVMKASTASIPSIRRATATPEIAVRRSRNER